MKKSLVNKIIIILTFLFILCYQYNFCYNFSSSITANAYPSIKLYPGGQPIGVELNTKGVLVIGLSDIEISENKSFCPAKQSDIKVGDSIIEIDKEKINNSEEVLTKISTSEGKELNFTIERNGKKICKKIKPVKSIDDKYKIGLWIRDSTTGIGTLTFYDPNSKKFGALGHAITDMDTGNILNIKSGKLISSSIIGIKKGYRGKPGELKGIFLNNNEIIGNIKLNTSSGIFGKYSSMPTKSKYNDLLSVGYKNEVKLGKAKILTTISGQKPNLYDIEIIRVFPQTSPDSKSMMIKVTDKRLLSKTGGIIQGMSGSPIIQNNKIVGAVTHVLVNKPDIGYGIYIEWMLKESKLIS